MREKVFGRLTIDETRAEIASVSALSSDVGCLYYPGEDQSKMLVIFAGNGEGFLMLSVARRIRCSILYFQEPKNFWYRGGLLPDIQGISDFIAEFPRQTKIVLFGQSSGGYAALAASRSLTNCVAIGVSPQTYSDATDKARIHCATPLRPTTSPDGLLDLREHLSDAAQAQRAIIFSSSEADNPQESFLWLDHLHAFRMLNVGGINLYLMRATRHPLVFKRAEMFSLLLSELLGEPDSSDCVIKSHVNQMSAET